MSPVSCLLFIGLAPQSSRLPSIAAGATQLPAGKKTTDPEVAVYVAQSCDRDCIETHVQLPSYSNIASGGGFSNYFATPAYQASTVQSYLSANKSPYASGTFNATGRGFPDISANGYVD